MDKHKRKTAVERAIARCFAAIAVAGTLPAQSSRALNGRETHGAQDYIVLRTAAARSRCSQSGRTSG